MLSRTQLEEQLKSPALNAINFISVPLSDKIIKRFRELSEDLWIVNKFNAGPFAEAEVIPLIASAGEIDDEGAFKTYATHAITSDFEELLGNLEFTLAVSVNKASILRAIMVRLKSGKKISKHIDDTFRGVPHEIYRCQIVGGSTLSFYDEKTELPTVSLAQEEKTAIHIQSGTIQSEENSSLSDSIHLILYMQARMPDEIQRNLGQKNQQELEIASHRKIYGTR